MAAIGLDIQLLNAPVRYVPVDAFPPPAGAECVFLGRTRIETHPRHGRLVRLAYEAYQPMALRVLTDLAQAAGAQFGCLFIRVHHALGEVPPGEASVLVQTVCARRDAAFASCRQLVDLLKSQAPIWKREHWADGSTWSAGVPVNVRDALATHASASISIDS